MKMASGPHIFYQKGIIPLSTALIILYIIKSPQKKTISLIPRTILTNLSQTLSNGHKSFLDCGRQIWIQFLDQCFTNIYHGFPPFIPKVSAKKPTILIALLTAFTICPATFNHLCTHTPRSLCSHTLFKQYTFFSIGNMESYSTEKWGLLCLCRP